jgi:hypothetical protein
MRIAHSMTFANLENSVNPPFRCIAHGECQFWTWKGNKRCVLIRSDRYTAAAHPGSVSGTLSGPCATLALSQLTRCECVRYGQDQFDDQDNFDNYDLSGLINIRENGDHKLNTVLSLFYSYLEVKFFV